MADGFEKLTQDLHREFSGARARASAWFEQLARGERYECAWCGKPVNTFGDGSIIDLTFVTPVIYHAVCHQDQGGYGWRQTFPQEDPVELIAELERVARALPGALELVPRGFDLVAAGMESMGDGPTVEYASAMEWLELFGHYQKKIP